MTTSQLNTIILDFTNLLLSYIDQIRSTYTISQKKSCLRKTKAISIESIYFLDNTYQIQIKIIPASFLSPFLLSQQSLFDHYLLSLFNSLIKTYNLQMNTLNTSINENEILINLSFELKQQLLTLPSASGSKNRS